MSAVNDRKAEAESARARLKTGIDALRARTTPQSLMIDIKAEARKRAVALASSVAASPMARSAVAVGAISGGLAYLFRKPLLKAIATRLTPETEND